MWQVTPAGDRGLLVTLGHTIDPALLGQVLALDKALADRRPSGLISTVPAYASLLCHYDAGVTDTARLQASILELEGHLDVALAPGSVLDVPARSAGALQARRPAAIHPDVVIEVVDAGRWTTVQDRGRPGLERFGLPPGGAADWFAAAVANRIVGNPQDAAILECTATGPTLRFSAAAVVALAGGHSTRAANWQPIPIAQGASLTVGTIAPGLRSYIAVRGGIDVPPVLGSRSFCQRGSFGGGFGRPLQRGDALAVGRLGDRDPLSAPWPESHRLPA